MKSKGFTLIELLVVIGIVAILATIVLVAINPARQFAVARNTSRKNDLYQILNAVHQYAVDHSGQYPTQINSTFQDIGTGGLNLDDDLVPNYIPAIPYDPQDGNETTTNYVLAQESDGRFTATATSAEVNTHLTITR